MILLLALAALLYFPALRRGVGAFLWGALMTIVLAITFGAGGVIVAWVIGAVWFVHGFYRPGPHQGSPSG